MSTGTIYVFKTKASCEGEGHAMGHPLVYLDLSRTGEAECPYCGQKFKLKQGQHESH